MQSTTSRFPTLALASGVALLFLTTPAQGQSGGLGAGPSALEPAAVKAPDAAEILAAINAVEELNPGPQVRGDAESNALWTAQSTFYRVKKAKLIGDLWRIAPDSPELVNLMAFRWQNTGNLGVDITPEVEAFTAAHPDATEAVRTGRYFVANGAVMQYRAGEEAAAKADRLVESFLNDYPDDPQGATLLYMVTRYSGDEARTLEINKRLAADYSDTQYGKAAVAQIKQAEGVGKTFELAFTDHLTGKAISMDELRGKVVVIDFWATWCGPCVAEMPNMKKLYAEYKDKGVEFIGVSLDQAPEQGGGQKLTAYCEENGITWPQYYQGNYWQSEFSSGWGINGIPCLFIVDKEGRLHSTKARGQLETLIPELLAK